MFRDVGWTAAFEGAAFTSAATEVVQSGGGPELSLVGLYRSYLDGLVRDLSVAG